VIERRRCGITIRRGGSHRQTQRLERGLRARSTVLGDTTVFCADLLYTEGRAVLDLVQSYFASKSSRAELHRPSRRSYRRNLLSIHRRSGVPFGGHSTRFRSCKTVLPRFTGRAPVGVDRPIRHIRCLFAARAALSFAGLAFCLQYPGAGGLDRIRLRR